MGRYACNTALHCDSSVYGVKTKQMHTLADGDAPADLAAGPGAAQRVLLSVCWLVVASTPSTGWADARE
eukprot:11186552-Lingulodinium_polyedra.AAC.1